MKEKVIEALESIRPALQSHGGDVEFVSVSDDGIVKVRLTGACSGCPHAQMTLTDGVERQLKEMVPEVKSVQAV
jgi:Fe-S cluster biogenesis protein NfuA